MLHNQKGTSNDIKIGFKKYYRRAAEFIDKVTNKITAILRFPSEKQR